MIAVPGALEHLTMFSYHRYASDLGVLQQIADRAVLHGLDTGMLEWWFGNATYEVLHEDLTIGRNSDVALRSVPGMIGSGAMQKTTCPSVF